MFYEEESASNPIHVCQGGWLVTLNGNTFCLFMRKLQRAPLILNTKSDKDTLCSLHMIKAKTTNYKTKL